MVIDINKHEGMTLGFIQSLDGKTLKSEENPLVNWHSDYLIKRKDQRQKFLTGWLVSDGRKNEQVQIHSPQIIQ